MPLLTYLGHASLFLACLYSAYWLLFHREAFHQLNRLILLLIIAATLALPKVPASSALRSTGCIRTTSAPFSTKKASPSAPGTIAPSR